MLYTAALTLPACQEHGQGHAKSMPRACQERIFRRPGIPQNRRQSLASGAELFEFLGDGIVAELVGLTKHPLASCFCSHAAEDDAVQERVAPQTIVAMHASCHLARCIESRDYIF